MKLAPLFFALFSMYASAESIPVGTDSVTSVSGRVLSVTLICPPKHDGECFTNGTNVVISYSGFTCGDKLLPVVDSAPNDRGGTDASLQYVHAQVIGNSAEANIPCRSVPKFQVTHQFFGLQPPFRIKFLGTNDVVNVNYNP